MGGPAEWVVGTGANRRGLGLGTVSWSLGG